MESSGSRRCRRRRVTIPIPQARLHLDSGIWSAKCNSRSVLARSDTGMEAHHQSSIHRIRQQPITITPALLGIRTQGKIGYSGTLRTRTQINVVLTITLNTRECISNMLHPVARLRFDTKGQDVLCGPWELCVPSRQSYEVNIIGRGELVPSWHAALGLQGEFEGTSRWSQIDVAAPPEADKALDRPLSGTYTLRPKCGQAMTSLHKKDATSVDDGLPPLFFFLDPTRCGEAEDDSYVFSTSIERLDFGTERAVIAVFDPKWRESSKPKESVRLDIRGGWVIRDDAHLTAVGGEDIAVSTRSDIHRDSRTCASSLRIARLGQSRQRGLRPFDRIAVVSSNAQPSSF